MKRTSTPVRLLKNSPERLAWLSLPIKDQRKDQYLRRTYGLTLTQFRKMEFEQKGLCKICLRKPKPGKSLHVDHDHKPPHRVRGLLCFRCNHRLLGRGLENAFLHTQAANYLLSDFDGRTL